VPSVPAFAIAASVRSIVTHLLYASSTSNVRRSSPTRRSSDLDDTGTKKLKGDLLTVQITQANLFIGNGASLDINPQSATFGTVVDRESTHLTSSRESVTNAGLDLDILTATQSSTDGTAAYTAL